MKGLSSTYVPRYQNALRELHEFFALYSAVSRKAELERLIDWAVRKHLPGPQKLYKNRLQDEELHLARHNMYYPRLVYLAYVLYGLSQLISPTPRYLPKGSAWKYR